jgi:autotransporter translocation and assembly factor TamB
MRRLAVIGGAALVALAVLAAALLFHDALAGAILRAVASGAGYNVRFERLQVGFTGATALGTTVTNRAGEPVFEAGRIDVRYSIRNVLPGSNRRRFGISSLDIQRPTVTLIHHADGTYNVALPANSAAATPDTSPIELRLRIRDGSVVLLDRFLVPGQERRQRLVGFAMDGAIAPHAHSYYNARFDIEDGHTLYPVIGKAKFSADHGFEAQHWTAADIPIGPLVDFALPSHTIDIVDGNMRNVDGRIYTFVDPDGATHVYTSLRADLENGKIYVAGMLKPLRDARGQLLAYDNGLTTTRIDATVAGVPLHFEGGIYDLAAPKLRFAMTGRGPIAQLQQVIAPAQRQPLTGDLTFAVRGSGALNAPVVSGSFSAPAMTYRGFPVRRPGGTFSVHGSDLDLLGASFDYGPVNVEVHGALALEKETGVNLVVILHAPGDRLPYVSQLLRGLPLTSVVHVSGTGRQLASAGIVYGDARDGRLDGLFNVSGNGVGVIGPLSIERNDGASLYARVAIDRTKSSVLGIVDAHRLSLRPGAIPSLPGFRLAQFPPVAGTLDAQVVGAVDASRLDELSGHVRLAGVRYGALTANASADLGTASDGSQTGAVDVTSSLGKLQGTAAYADGFVGFAGRVTSSFAQLQSVTGSLGARGHIDGTLLALTDGAASAVQVPNLRFTDASVAGVPIRSFAATATFQRQRLDVRTLQIGIAGGTATAQGTLGDGGELDVTTSALDLRTLAGHGVPLTAGTLRANAHVHGTLEAPQATVALLVDGARWHGIAMSGNAFTEYAGGTLHVHDATALAFDAYAGAAGDIRGLNGPGPATLDVTANLRGAQVAPIAKALRLPLRYPDGEIDADVHATGNANAPQIVGTVRVPQGSLNGLNFRDGKVAISGGPGNVAARNGSVTVGTTAIAFSGDAGSTAQQFELRAPRVNLADFDDYFDAAETLAGTGHVIANAGRSGAGLSTSGDVLITDARYRRFAVGNVAAAWQTVGRTVHATAGVKSDRGAIAFMSDAVLPPNDPLRNVRARTTLTASATLTDLDLAQWLPTAGVTLPILGTVNGSAHASGTLAAPAFDATAAVTNGVVRGYALSSFTLAASGDTNGARLTALHLAGAALTADASGSFGYRPSDPVAIALHAQSDDVAVLAKSLGAKLDISGALTTTVNASGTRNAPRVSQTIDATNFRYEKYTIPHLHAQLAADPQTLQLQAFQADLVRGRLLASATLPIRITAPVGLRNAPLTASLGAEGIDLVQFETLLPNNAKLGGTIDGQISARGTQADPTVAGTLTLAGGSYSSSLLRSAATNGRARLDFTQKEARLTGAHTDVGGGTIDGTASATFGDLRALQRTLAVNAQFTAKNAALDIAGLLRTTIDGTLTAEKPPGDIPTLGGTLAFSKARISPAVLIPKGPVNPTTRVPPTVAFALNVQLGNDVRVQGPAVDVGMRGAVAVGGNLAHPELDGRITSTSGTLSFYRTFVLQRGTVAFHPADGLIPNVDAEATTHVTNPDTDILLHVTGPATNLNLDLASNPSYDKAQILGLLVNAQALGAVPGIETSGSGGGFSAEGIAGGFLAQEFTQNLLQPVGSGIGQALGFQDLALGYNFGSGLSAGARKQLGKNVSVSVNQTFGGDQRESLALNYNLQQSAAIALTAFNAGNLTPQILTTRQLFAPVGPVNYTLQALAPPPGVAGVVLTYQRKFR